MTKNCVYRKLRKRWIDNTERIARIEAMVCELDSISASHDDTGIIFTSVYRLMEQELSMLHDENRFIEKTDALKG